jgi:hypothetical protein
MIEILVSAIILVTVSLAVFSTLTNADTAAGNQQTRSLAANFAQSEIEHIRSLPVEDIQDLPATSTIQRDNIIYTLKTTTKWVSDGQDEPECTSTTGGVDYMRITASVTWTGMGRQTAPVSLTSLFTPAAGSGGGDTGSVSVHLTDRDGDPTVGIPVTLDGISDFAATTNENGCVVFAFIPVGTYTVGFNRVNYVNENSIGSPTDTTKVLASETNKLAYSYDTGGYTKATFKTHFASGDDRPTYPPQFGFYHSGRTSLSPLVIDQSASPASSWDGTVSPATSLYPFTSPYSVFVGQCATNVVPAGDPNYAGVNIGPLTVQGTGTVWAPSLDVEVRDGTNSSSPGNVVVGANVMFDGGCGIWSRPTVAAGSYGTPGVTVAAGHLVDTGFPYAPTGKLCAATTTRKSGITSVALKDTTKATKVTIYLGAGTTGSFPTKACM